MKFTVFEVDEIDKNIVCEYLEEEESLCTIFAETDSSLVIENTYLTLDFDTKSNYIKAISGYIGDINRYVCLCRESKARFLNAKLRIDEMLSFDKCVGYSFGFNGYLFFDSIKKILYISSAPSMPQIELWYRIANNICVALENEELLAIRIDLKREKTAVL